MSDCSTNSIKVPERPPTYDVNHVPIKVNDKVYDFQGCRWYVKEVRPNTIVVEDLSGFTTTELDSTQVFHIEPGDSFEKLRDDMVSYKDIRGPGFGDAAISRFADRLSLLIILLRNKEI